MRSKFAYPVQLAEHRECSHCHGYVGDGFLLKDENAVRFVCQDCFNELGGEYVPGSCRMIFGKDDLDGLFMQPPGFSAGYLLGTKEPEGEDGWTVTVKKRVPCANTGCATMVFFTREDILAVRQICQAEGLSIVGIYRTSPIGSASMNDLDRRLLATMKFDIVYAILGGAGEIQILAVDKAHPDGEIGVVIV